MYSWQVFVYVKTPGAIWKERPYIWRRYLAHMKICTKFLSVIKIKTRKNRIEKWTTYLNKHFTQGNTNGHKKHKNKTNFVSIEKMQIKILQNSMSYFNTSKHWEFDNLIWSEDIQNWNFLYTIGGSIKWYNPYEKAICLYHIKINIHVLLTQWLHF